MEYIRCFIAIELPEELKIELRRLQGRLKSGGPDGIKWVEPDGIHLTLKFLGEAASDKVTEIATAMAEAARGISPFRLEVRGAGAFPNLSRVQVVWVGIVGEVDKLARLVENIEAKVSPLGFPTEARPFAPHLTLARLGNKVLYEDRKKFGQLIAAASFESNTVIEVKSVNLIRSQLTRQGAIYSRMGQVELK